MYCTNCGHEIKDGAKFCNNCGTAIDSTKVITPVDATKKSSSNKKMRILLPTVIATLAILVVVILAISNRPKRQQSTTAQPANTASISTSTPTPSVSPTPTPTPSPTPTPKVLMWPDHELSNLLTIPESEYGEELISNEEEVKILVEQVSLDAFNSYVANCIESGFTESALNSDTIYTANNTDGYRLNVHYTNDSMVIMVLQPLPYIQIEINCDENLIFSTYNIDIYVNGEQIDTVKHGASKVFDFTMEKGNVELKITKEGDKSVFGRTSFEIIGPMKFVYTVHCNSDKIAINKEYTESLVPLTDEQTKVPASADHYHQSTFDATVQELEAAGFTNITSTPIYDITKDSSIKEGSIETISINGNSEFDRAEIFNKEDAIIITYHVSELTAGQVAERFYGRKGEPANTLISAFDGTGYAVVCTVQQEEINNVNLDEYVFDSGWVDADTKTVYLDFKNEEMIVLENTLEEAFPQEYAKRAAVVALTNGYASDVFKSDGNTYDKSKFHSYRDISGFFLSVVSEGSWNAVNETTWNVKNLKCIMSGTGTYLKATLDITLDDDYYIISNADVIVASEMYIDSDDSTKINREHFELTDSTPFLKVSHSLIKKDRDFEAEIDMLNRTTPTEERTSWIENQFGIWNGKHKDLEDLVKQCLHDEKSYKHSETEYIDITTDELVEMVNDILKDSGYSDRVELGDLFITLEFTAKNAFDATRKNMAIGIASYSNNTIKLVDIIE